ncbi:MAG TPA: class I tRNA ligase family protein, partial [Anaerolineales bacterium]|nr:class I tRNA ligase family protein [Anaerolineales bacterium]
YGQAGQQIYDFIWSDFADWYVEIAKEQMKDDETRSSTIEILARIFDISLRLLHPFTPFVTEELWGHMRSALRESPLKDISVDWPDALIIAKWPEPHEAENWEEAKISQFMLLQDSIRAIRNLRAERSIKPSRKIGAVFVTAQNASLYKDYLPMISALASTDLEQTFVYGSEYKPSEAGTSLVVGSTNIYISGMEALEEDKTRLEKELKEAQSHIERLEKLLAGDFANKAPAQLVQKEREKLEGYKETADKIKAQLQ